MDPDDIIAIQALFSLQNSSDLALTVNAETIPIEIIMPNDNTTWQFDPLISMKEYMQWDLHKSQLNSDEGLDNYEDKIEQFDDQDEGIIMQEFCRARNKRVVDGRIRKTSKKIRKSTLKSGEVPQLRTVQRLRKLDDSGNKFNGSGPILVSQSFPERKGQTDDQKVKAETALKTHRTNLLKLFDEKLKQLRKLYSRKHKSQTKRNKLETERLKLNRQKNAIVER